MSDARKIIADTVIAELHSVLGDAKCQLRMTELGADAILAALADAGLVIVPREPTEKMIAAPVDHDDCIYKETTRKVWRAMVEAANEQ
jgi:hypothetical protein